MVKFGVFKEITEFSDKMNSMLPSKSIEALNKYINDVMDKHCKHKVNEVVLVIAGAVMSFTTSDIELRRDNNDSAEDMLWFYIDDKCYALLYNHQTEQIDLIDHSMYGRVLHSFDNTWTAFDVKNAFSFL